jgi:hypothetical protein
MQRIELDFNKPLTQTLEKVQATCGNVDVASQSVTKASDAFIKMAPVIQYSIIAATVVYASSTIVIVYKQLQK